MNRHWTMLLVVAVALGMALPAGADPPGDSCDLNPTHPQCTNEPPSANDDPPQGTISVSEGGAIEIDVVSNDTDDSSIDVTTVVAADGSHGVTAVDAITGAVTYTHDHSNTFSDSFSYAVSDDEGAVSNTATVRIAVVAVNDTVPAVDTTTQEPDLVMFIEGDSPGVIHSGIRVRDQDGLTLVSATVTISGGDESGVDVLACNDCTEIESTYSDGVLTLTGERKVGDYEAALRSITFANDSDDPSPVGFPPDRSVTYVVDDGVNVSEPATVTFTVIGTNDPPVVTSDPTFEIFEGAPVGTTIGVVSASDVDSGDVLEYSILPTGSGGATFAIDPSGLITLADASSLGTAPGSHSLTIAVSDGEATVEANVTVSVVNMPPTLASFNIYDITDSPRGRFEPGEVVIFRGSFEDHEADTHSLSIDWGDGATATVEIIPGVRTFDAAHVYTQEGPMLGFHAVVTLSDDDGASSELAGPVIVTAQVGSIGLVDPSRGLWRLIQLDGVINDFHYGNPGDFPIVGDWDCDGTETPGMYRQSDGFAYLRNSNTPGTADLQFFLGDPGDIPLAGDFDGDGCDTVSVYRPSNQTFYFANSLGPQDGGFVAEFSFIFGDPGDKPFVGDFDGDGPDEVGLHRESTGLVYYRNNLSAGPADNQFFWGDPGDRVVAADWNGDGADSPGLFRPSNRYIYLRFINADGNADVELLFPGSGSAWLPVSGHFG